MRCFYFFQEPASAHYLPFSRRSVTAEDARLSDTYLPTSYGVACPLLRALFRPRRRRRALIAFLAVLLKLLQECAPDMPHTYAQRPQQ